MTPQNKIPANTATIKVKCWNCKAVIKEVPLNQFRRDGVIYEYCPVCGHRPGGQGDEPL